MMTEILFCEVFTAVTIENAIFRDIKTSSYFTGDIYISATVPH
jgi:hypothetical protein